MKIKKLKSSIKDLASLEGLASDNAKQKDMIDYIAIMSDIEIPEESTNESNGESTKENED